MSVISAQAVKELREKTGAGMMDCKKALTESNGDIEAAIDWLRTKGLAKAAKKSDRVTAEGLVAVALSDKSAAIVELNSETDFVARNDAFQKLASELAAYALNSGLSSVDKLNDLEVEGSKVSDKVTSAIATIGENLTLRRVSFSGVENGIVSSYIHNSVAPNMGKIGVLVALETKGNNVEELQAIGKNIAMHVAAANPIALNDNEIPQDVLDREANVLREKALEQGKPEQVIEKIVASGLKSYAKEVSLLDQAFIMDPSKNIAQVLKESAGKVGGEITVKSFIRFELGEGIEKNEGDFASEVAAAAGS